MNYRSCTKLVCGLVCVVSSLRAQTAASDTTPPKESTVVLSPFVVNTGRDVPYRANSSITGTGTAGLIKDTPMNLSILTSEFITDTGGDQLVDFLRAAPTVNAHVKDDSVITVRGFNATIFRDGLPVAEGFEETYDIDRVEIVKGPNAVFAGSASPGGTVNFIRIEPTFYTTGSLQVTGGDYDSSKVIFKSSGPLIKNRLAYNFVYGDLNKDNSVQYMHIDERFLEGGLTYRVTDKIELNAYYADLKRDQGRRPYLTVSNPVFQSMDKEAIATYDNNHLARPSRYPKLQAGQVLDAAGNPITTTAEGTPLRTVAQGPEDVATFIGRTLTGNAALQPFTEVAFLDFFGNNPDYNYNGPQGREQYKNQDYGLRAQWLATSDLSFKFDYNHNRGSRERVEYNGFRPVAAQSLRSAVSDTLIGSSGIITYQGVADYKRDFGGGGQHNLLLGAQYLGGEIVTGQTNVSSGNILFNPRTDTTLMLNEILQKSNPALKDFTGLNYSYTDSPSHTTSYFGVLQSAFWHDRLRTVIGARHVDTWTAKSALPVGTTDQNFSKTVPQYSALFRLTPQLSLFGNYTKVFRQVTVRTADLEAIEKTQGSPSNPNYVPPTVIPQHTIVDTVDGKGAEIGLKFDLDNTLTTTLSYFQNEEAGSYQSNSVLQTLYQLPGGAIVTKSGLNRTKGLEGEATWSPTSNYQAIASFSYFFERDNVTDVSNPLQQGHGLETVPKFGVNLWNKYTFTKGSLKGLYVGAGFNILGSFWLHPSYTITVQSSTSVIYNALLGYATSLKNVPLDFRLNVLNLTDELYYGGTFEYGDRRTFTLSCTTKW